METKRSWIDRQVRNIYSKIPIDRPENHEQIVDFVLEDINETADPVDYSSGDVDIAFRRFLEQNFG